MKTVTKDGVTSVVAQNEVVIPDLTIKDLLSAIPSVPSFFSKEVVHSLCRIDLVLTVISGRHSALVYMCK
jgi:omega-6 fatty acid desaturase (delta-12 desaturase)